MTEILGYVAVICLIVSALEWWIFRIFLHKRRDRIERDLGPLHLSRYLIHPWPLFRRNYERITDPGIRRHLKWFAWTIYLPLALFFVLGLLLAIVSGPAP
ncbi:hypothetical protein [Jannaschia aquimarina]|nr:hypothetical protein [Jannaschia aquimarina]